MGLISSAWDLASFYLGIGVFYVLSAILIAGGAYLAVLFNLAAANPLYWLLRPLRWVGICLVGLGIILASYTYGKSTGAAVVMAEWKAKNLEAKLERAQQESKAQQAAAETAKKEVERLAAEKGNQDEQIAQYQTATEQLSKEIAACRRASSDDDRRVCGITGNSAAGCKNTK